MPSLRKRVTSYFRQLSFHNEPREKRLNVNENSFVTKYLQGQIKIKDGPAVISGKNPSDLPNFHLGIYNTGPDTVIGCYTGPNGGLSTVKRTEKHLSITDADIDFIDTQEENATVEIDKKCLNRSVPIDNTTMIIKVGGQEYFVTSRKHQQPKSHSLGSLSDIHVNVDKTDPIDKNDSIKSLNIVTTNEIGENLCDLNNCDKNKSVTKSRKLNNDSSQSKKVCKTSSQKDFRRCSATRPRSDSNTSRKKPNEIKHKDPKQRHSSVENHNQYKDRSKATNAFSDKKNTKINELEKSEKSIDEHEGTYSISKSKSEGNPFQHRKKGKIIRIMQRPTSTASATTDPIELENILQDDLLLPEEWNRKTDHVYGISDSLYDTNQITKTKNGDPIADCFGIVARNDSAILAVADGVNWGEKASIAAKSAIHGCLHYLNKTIFNDVKNFENLIKSDSSAKCETPLHETHITNTQEVFVCLLRAFNCAHDLILENNGMLTTLTVAVILPLKQTSIETKDTHQKSHTTHGKPQDNKSSTNEVNFICCVCNVGDTLAYVYSQKYGIRELTKGSHDIHCNRDMRDALGALGPVDGINPELSNLTLSITKIQKGDIVLVASDGLTDNFDPNVCKFTVNSNLNDPLKSKRPHSNQSHRNKENKQPEQQKKVEKTREPKKIEEKNKPPIKPPRRNYTKHKDNISRSSEERRSNSEESNRTKESNSKVDESLNATIHIVETLDANFDQPKVDKNQRDLNSDLSNPLVAQFMRENSINENDSLEKCRRSLETKKSEPKPSSQKQPSSHAKHTNNASKTLSVNRNLTGKQIEIRNDVPKYSFLRSKTSLDLRPMIVRNEDGLPYVTPIQRYELTLLLMEDVLKHGISGRESQCVRAKKLCENLLSFTFSITAAKRHTLEDNDLYFDNRNGLLVELSAQEKKIRRKRGLERVQNLPGKLDHVTVVAFNVGNFSSW